MTTRLCPRCGKRKTRSDLCYQCRGILKRNPDAGPVDERRVGMAALSLQERFWAKVNKTETCWLWTARLDKDGYGQFQMEGRARGAHVVAWEFEHGPVPPGLQIDHKCRVRRCVRHHHLEPVTGKVNVHRGEGPAAVNVRKTHCIHGHEFTPENTYTQRHKDGSYKGRGCLACRREAHKRQDAKRKARRSGPSE